MGPEFLASLTPQERANLIHIMSDPLKFAERFCVVPNGPDKGEPFYANYPQRQVMANRGMVNYLLVHRRGGKCTSEFTEVLDRNTLKPTPLKDIPTNTEVLVFDFELSEVVWSKAVKIAAGKKPCLKIHTDTGTQLSISTDHPLFEARKGWITADMLHMGDRILCPGSMPVFGSLVADSNKINELYDKYVEESEFPSEVYLLNKKSLKAFLTKYWEEEGRIFDQFKSVIFMLMSREICLPLKHLLLRFGVESRITPEGNLVIDDPLDLSTFFNLVGIEYPRYEVRSPRRWETITLIKKIGEWECYDFQVEHVDANFIAEDVVIHNSYIMDFFALYHAVTEVDKNIVVFAPAKPQIDEFFRNLDAWINTNPIFSDYIDKNGEQRNNPYPIRSFLTGSRIVGYITGINEGTEQSKRGLTADVCICFPYSERVLTDIGYLPIGEIVEENKAKQVLTQNSKGKLEWKNILRRIVNPIGNKYLVEIVTTNGRLVCTENHPIYTNRGYISADKLVLGDTLIYDRSIRTIHLHGESDSYRHLIRRRVVLVSSEGEHKCETDITPRSEARELSYLEVREVTEVVQHRAQESEECGLWGRVLCGNDKMPSGIHKDEKSILPRRKKDYNSGAPGFSGSSGSSSVDGRRWIEFWGETKPTHSGVQPGRKHTDSKSPNRLTGRRRVSYKTQEVSYDSYTELRQGRTKRFGGALFSTNASLQNKFTSTRRQDLLLVRSPVLPQCFSLANPNILCGLPTRAFPKVQICLGTEKPPELQKVYDLEIEDNHNFFVEGILVHNCDESQAFSDADWRLIHPIMQGEQRRDKFGNKKGRRGTVRSYVAGTVMDPTGFFYEKTNDIVPLAPNERVFRIPIDKNEDFTPEDLEEMRLSMGHTSWVTEYLLQYGDTRSSVFRQSDIEIASATDWEYGIENTDRSLVRFIGVDWDHGSEKSKAGTNIVVVQYNPYTGDMTTIERIEVPPEEYTFLKACHLVIDYAFVYGPIDGIIVDMGQGIFQGEWLKDQCIQRGMSDLASKVTVLHLGKVIPVQVIGEEEPRRVFAKEFLVGLLQKKFQEKKVVFPSHDTKFREQLISYKKIGETQRGAKYSSGNEHIIDAHLFCMYGIWTYYEEQALTSPKFSPDHAYTEVGVEHTRLPFEMEMNQYNNNWTDARVTRTGEDGRPKDQGFDRGIRDSFRNQGRGSIFD